MENYRNTILFLFFFFCVSGKVFAQSHANEIIQRTVSKIQVINQNLRIVEKTFADIIFSADTTSANNVYFHKFSSSNTYHINGFASSQDVSDINVLVCDYDRNDKLEVVARDNITGSDVSFTFDPTKSGTYFLVVTATLKADVKNCFFNLIIDRE